MNATLENLPEKLKLARLLQLEPAQLDFLDGVDPRTLTALREQVTAVLFDSDRAILHRIASASRLVPVAAIALIAQHAFGPLLCARVASYLPAERAIEVARRLETEFLADTCLELDPRRVRAVIEGMPVVRIVEIALSLARRREFVTMGRFVDCMTPAAIRAVLSAVKCEAVLLRIAFFIEHKPRIEEIARMLSEERLRKLVEAAMANDGELWPQALTLISSVSEAQQLELLELAARDVASLASLIRAADEGNLWSTLRPLLKGMDATHQQRLLDLLPKELRARVLEQMGS